MTVWAVKTTARRLAVVMDALDITGMELARRLAEHPDWNIDNKVENVVGYVRRWKRGRLPEVERTVMLADCLDITVGQLVGTEPLPSRAAYAKGEAVKKRVAEARRKLESRPRPTPADQPRTGSQGRQGSSRKAAS